MKRVLKSPTLESDRKNLTFWLFGSCLVIVKAVNKLYRSASLINISDLKWQTLIMNLHLGVFGISTRSCSFLEKH